MSFCDTSFHTYENVTNMLKDYASRHPDILLELEFSSETEDHELIRFRGDEVEKLDRMEMFPPFVNLTRNGDDNSPPVLEFNFTPVSGDDKAHILVLLDQHPLPHTLEALKDSIASYYNRVPLCNFDQLIHDVLSSEGIKHWILKPSHSFVI